MQTFHYFLFLCCGFAAACSSANQNFPIEESLSPELMPLQGITSPMMVEIKPPYLILENIKQQDSLFHIYDLTNYELKCAFGKKGNGPSELISPALYQTPISEFVIGDFGKNQIQFLDIDHSGQPVLKKTKRLGYDNALYDAAFINDSMYVADPKYMLEPSLYLMNISDSLPMKIWTYRNPNIIDYILDPDMGNSFANENRIIFCYGYKKQIDFMDTEFNLIKRVKFDYTPPAIITGDNYGDVDASYSYGHLGNRYLYIIFLGTSWKKHRANSTCGTFLEVFDLVGKPMARYHLKGRCPVRFVVDEETFTIYGVGEDCDPEDNLLVYKLNGLS